MGMLTVSTHHPYESPGSGVPQSIADRWPYYLRAAGHVDRFLAKLVQRLREEKLLDDTVLVFVGDHGESFGDANHPGFGGHDACPYDECTHVPLVLYGPHWLGAPREIEGLRHEVDLLPTLLDLSGAKWVGSVPGEDLLTSRGHPKVYSSCYWERTCLVERMGNLAAIYSFDDHPLRCQPPYRPDGDERSGEPLPGELPSGADSRAALVPGVGGLLLRQRCSLPCLQEPDRREVAVTNLRLSAFLASAASAVVGVVGVVGSVGCFRLLRQLRLRAASNCPKCRKVAWLGVGTGFTDS